MRTGRQVAIKVPHLEAESDPVFFERFRREDEIGQTLDTPASSKCSALEKSSVYIVMEWAEGKLLRELLREQGSFPLSALSALHSRSAMRSITFTATALFIAT